MRGLLVKDFRLLRQRIRFFAMLVVIAVFMAASGSAYGGSFVAGYLTLVVAMFSLSTISYDEYDNCYCFLMTLPIDRRIYVKEKYIFGAILGLAAWLIGVAIQSGALFFHHQQAMLWENLTEALVYIPIFLVMIALILPFQLKYGVERGRLALLAAVGLVAAAVWTLVKLGGRAGLSLAGLLARMSGLGDGQILTGCFLLAAAVTFFSFLISVRIMERKEL